MDPRELLSQSLRALLASRLRSALTLVGIVLGVASIIVGVAAGMAPALRGAKLDPVEALRHE